MYDELWRDPSMDNAWRRKLDALGYRHKAVDMYKLEGECPICAKGAPLFPIGSSIDVCPHCFKRFANYNNMSAIRKFSVTVKGTRCILCEHNSFYYIHITGGRLCTKCFWSKLGKRKERLRDSEGSRV